MMAAKQGDASEMWTRKMIEHHRGAIGMSRVAVRDAKDAETRQMAQMTITKQEKDVAELEAWLRKHGKSPEQALNRRVAPACSGNWQRRLCPASAARMGERSHRSATDARY